MCVGTVPARSLQNVVKYATKVEMGHYAVEIFMKLDKVRICELAARKFAREAGERI